MSKLDVTHENKCQFTKKFTKNSNYKYLKLGAIFKIFETFFGWFRHPISLMWHLVTCFVHPLPLTTHCLCNSTVLMQNSRLNKAWGYRRTFEISNTPCSDWLLISKKSPEKTLLGHVRPYLIKFEANLKKWIFLHFKYNLHLQLCTIWGEKLTLQ